MATDRLLELEDIEPFNLKWDRVESDVGIAVEARKMIARRRRFLLEHDRMMGIVKRQLITGFSQFVEGLPEGCFDDWEYGEEPQFAVPLASLLDRPAETIERLILSLYDDDTLHFELFERVRGQITLNILVASGFPPTANPHELAGRLVMPTRHKSRSATELVDLYLSGTPFESLFALPVPFRVPDALRFEHCHIVGGTGHGKTQLMQRMIHADLVAAKEDGRSVVVIDSQGDLISKLVRLDLFSPYDPESLASRLVLIDPSDVEYPASLNLFDAPWARFQEYGLADRERILNGVVELYESFFGALLGAELTQKQGVVFRYLARLMLAISGATIHTLMELMEDGHAYRPVMQALKGSARHFFEKEFFHPSFAATKKQILRRLWGVLSTPAFERMFVQKENKLDLFAAMNEGKIVLINTAKDLLKTDGSQLFGRFFVSMLAQAALERSTIPEHARTSTFVYVDEAQEYFDDTIETILSQARKYRLGITLAHQTLDQLSPRLRAAFLANTSFKCVGGVSSKDAHALASELHTDAKFIEGMRRRGGRTEFAAWLKNRTADAIRLTVPLGFLERQPTLPEDEYDELIQLNRKRYCGKLGEILAEPQIEPTPAPPPQAPVRESEPPAALPATHSASPVPPAPRGEGKGGPKHRYIQSLVKELGEQQGFRAILEAPLPAGAGQIDVLLVRDEVRMPFEVSVTTPAAHERRSIESCLTAGYERVALVLAKSRTLQGRYKTAVLEGLPEDVQARIVFLVPEDLPDFIASLAPAPDAADSIVRGYKVRTTHQTTTPEDARERRAALARVVARSLKDPPR